MAAIFGFVVGYLVGSSAGREGFEEVKRSVQEVRESEQFQGLVDLVRTHAGDTLRQVGDWVGGRGGLTFDDLIREAQTRLRR